MFVSFPILGQFSCSSCSACFVGRPFRASGTSACMVWVWPLDSVVPGCLLCFTLLFLVFAAVLDVILFLFILFVWCSFLIVMSMKFRLAAF
jgi:hypothetical protein